MTYYVPPAEVAPELNDQELVDCYLTLESQIQTLGATMAAYQAELVKRDRGRAARRITGTYGHVDLGRDATGTMTIRRPVSMMRH